MNNGRYKGVQEDRGGYRGVQVGKGGYKGVQVDRGEYRGVQVGKVGCRIYFHDIELDSTHLHFFKILFHPLYPIPIFSSHIYFLCELKKL